MTQQTAAVTKLKTWEVGVTYLCKGWRGSRQRVKILANDLNCATPICGVMLASGDGEVDEVYEWYPDGRLTKVGGSLDLTMELAP